MGPTFEGFKWFVTNIMFVPAEAMPNDTFLQTVYDESLNLAYVGLATIPSQPTSPSIYAWAVYNLGGHFLVEIAPDVPGSTYWEDLRDKLKIYSFTPGLMTGAADQGTSQTMKIPSQLDGLTMMGLELLKTPWGRRYLAIAGQWGAIWGLTA